MVTVWGRKNSLNVQKAIWALDEAGVPFDRIDAGLEFGQLDTESYGRLNPNRRVPTLIDGDTVVWESNAVVRYVAAKWSEGDLWPTDLAERAAADMWMDWMQTTVVGALIPVFFGLVRTPPDQRDMGLIAEKAIESGHVFQILDAALARRDYIAGSRFTMGDIPIGAATWRYLNLHIERPELLHIADWMDRLEKRPAFRKHIMLPLS